MSPTAEQQKAARDFEAIFLRQLLSSLEKGSGVSGGQSSGGAVFRSMMVGAMADKAAEGGGIGLSELILKAMLPPAAQGKLDLAQHVGAPQGGSAAGAPSGADPLDRLGSAVAASAPPSGASPTGAMDGAASFPTGSARLGVASQVLTEARPARMLNSAAMRQPEAAVHPGGNTR